MTKKDAMRAAVEALQTALPYVEADLNERMRIYGPNREHRWRAEMDDRQQIDAALSLLRSALEEGEEPEEASVYIPPEKRQELQRELNALYRNQVDALAASPAADKDAK